MQMQHNTRKKRKIQNLACHTDMLALLIIMHAVIALLTKVCVHTIAEHREAIPVNTATQKKQQMAVQEVKKKKKLVVVVVSDPRLRSTHSSKEHAQRKTSVSGCCMEEQ